MSSSNAVMTSPTPLEAIQHIRKMRGGSQSHLMRGSDGNFHIVKFTNNPQCKRILANELIASRLGRLLGLPMPDAQIINVDEWLINHTPDLYFDSGGHTVKCRPGQQLAIRYVADPFTCNIFDYLPQSLSPRVTNLTDFSRMLVLDKWACNCDGRQVVFWRKVKDKYYRAQFIDHGYFFNAGEWTFPDLALHGVYYRNFVYQHVTGWNDFEPALSRAESIRTGQLFDMTNDIPVEWWAKENIYELPILIRYLFIRRAKIRELITDFRKSNRNPFPNWQDKPQVSVPALPTDSGECRA